MSVSEMRGTEEQEEPLWLDIPKSWKIAYSGRVVVVGKAALPHCLSAAQGTVKSYLFLKRRKNNRSK